MKASAWLAFALVIGATTLVSASPARFFLLLDSVQSVRSGESDIKQAPPAGGSEPGIFDESRWDDDVIYQ